MTGKRNARAAAAAGGLVSAAAALSAGELVAAALHPSAGPLVAAGSAFIDLTPGWLKDFAIRTFGERDKDVLLAGLTLAVAAFAALAGVLAPFRPYLAFGGMVTLGALAGLAALTRPGADWLHVLPSLTATAVGLLTLHLLRRAWLRAFAGGAVTVCGDGHGDRVSGPADGTARRTFLVTGGAVLGAAVLGGAGSRAIGAARDAAAGSGLLVLPAAAEPAPPLPYGSDLRLPGLSPFTTPNADFYRVDTALVVPRVPYENWRLRIHGLVDRPFELTMAQLLALPLLERDITLTCVSNEVGGPYVGHARWLGVDLAALLRRAGVHVKADQILSRSADGWTCGTPVETVLDGRDALVAVGMNGQTLSPVHGFPARMIIPGLYGYVSATKWLTDIKLTRFGDEQAYWTRRGWADNAPIKTASRIEVPGPFARLSAGPTTIAGTAWAQHRGVAAVEVRVDGGAWQQATLAPSPNPDTWRQWHLQWQATPGDHRIEARATDATGHTQPQQRAEPFPDGATGWHSVLATVT
ncbi:molybdopterin-dependent oxidoreductase [Nonomuraea sp. NPDC059194]|uniref:molybdopterin-dependent oxidoreductase n=1 Tax=Nonomuraea sp. NPDC059194 TaxID=3346764 RepID=UPI0036B5FD54